MENEGNDVRLRTVAKMVFVLPDGHEVPCIYDFGYGYPEDSARYMFEEGNYSCDCNKAIFISEVLEGFDGDDWPCENSIKIKGLTVLKEI